MTEIHSKQGGTTMQASPEDGFHYQSIPTKRSDNLTTIRSQRLTVSRKRSDESKIEFEDHQHEDTLSTVSTRSQSSERSSQPEMKSVHFAADASADPVKDYESLLPSTLEDIERSVSQNCPKSGTRYNANFVLRWDLMRYFEEGLPGFNPQSQGDLVSRSLAITGTAQAAYAATVSEYLKWRWPQNHTRMIRLVQFIKTGTSSRPFLCDTHNSYDTNDFTMSSFLLVLCTVVSMQWTV